MNDWVIVNQFTNYDTVARECKNLVFMIYGNNFQNILRRHINDVRI